MPASNAKVLFGPYAGTSRADIVAAHEAARAELVAFTTNRLSSSSVNGQQFTFDPNAEARLKNRVRDLALARSQVDPDFIAPKGTMQVRFADRL